MSPKSAILILIAIVVIGSVFLFFMLEFFPSVTEDTGAGNIQTQQPSQTETSKEDIKPFTTQEKKERLNETFEELNKDSSPPATAEDAAEKAAQTNDIFKELESADEPVAEDKTQAEIDREKEQRLEAIFNELNK